jgi:hypothetical protein
MGWKQKQSQEKLPQERQSKAQPDFFSANNHQ